MLTSPPLLRFFHDAAMFRLIIFHFFFSLMLLDDAPLYFADYAATFTMPRFRR